MDMRWLDTLRMGAGFQETSLVTGGLELSVSSPEFPEGGEGLSWSAMANDLINPVCSETYLKKDHWSLAGS